MQPDELQSYLRFMHEHLFDHVDIDPANIHIPDGTLPRETRRRVLRGVRAGDRATPAASTSRSSASAAPATSASTSPARARDSRTRLITLDQRHAPRRRQRLLRRGERARAGDHDGRRHDPRRPQVVLMAFGEHKAPIIAKRASKARSPPPVAASFLQQHPNAQIVLDAAAAGGAHPLQDPVAARRHRRLRPTWDDRRPRKAVDLAGPQVKKPILKLTDEDYNEHGLQDLLASRAAAPTTSTSRSSARCRRPSPAGPAASRTPTAPATAAPDRRIFPKRVLVFSARTRTTT